MGENNDFILIDSKNLPEKTQFNYPVLRNSGLPAIWEEPKKIKRPFFNRIQSVKWDDFFEIKKNKMVVFRITPHSSIGNNNRRLWKTIYKMLEMYDGIGSRIKRDGLKFTYREKDHVWFDVIFRQVDGQKKIEFYVSTTEYQAEKLKRKLENKMKAAFEQVDIKNLEIPAENTIIQEMKYLKHDIFSLNTSATEQSTPISGIMNTIDELQFDGDFARLSICAEAENRRKWVKNGVWAYEKLNKGKIPQRANVNAQKAVAPVKGGIGWFVNEINAVLTDTMQAFQNLFFKSEKNFQNEKIIKKPFSLEDEINSRHLSNATREKINLPVFKTRIYIAAHSDDRLTRDSIGETLSTAFNEIAENNELHGIKIKFNGRRVKLIKELNRMELSKQTKSNADVNLFSVDEMNKLALQMPTQDLQNRYEDALSVNKRIETDIPVVMRSGAGIDLGETEIKGKKFNISMPITNPDEFYRSYVSIGAQGAGKDTAIKNWVIDANLKYNISFIIPDYIVEEGQRGMADGIRDALPPEKIIDLNLFDEKFIIGMDLTEVVKRLGRKGNDRFADEIIDFFGDIEGLVRSKRILKTAAKASGGSLYNIQRLIEDEEFRADTIAQLIDDGNTRLAKSLADWGTNEDLGSKGDPILNRLDEFLGNDSLFDIFAQEPNPAIDFAKWMSEGKVIILRIPNGRGFGERGVKLLAHWIVLKAFMTRLLMSKEEKGNGCFLILNEPEQVETDGLSRLMGRIATEGRKEKLGSIYAFHHWGKLQSKLKDNLLGGGVNQFLFANDEIKTFEQSKHRLEPSIPVEQAVKLPAHHAIISVRAGGEVQNAFVCHMRPPVEQKFDNSFLTKRHAQIYGRSWESLQERIG